MEMRFKLRNSQPSRKKEYLVRSWEGTEVDILGTDPGLIKLESNKQSGRQGTMMLSAVER